MQRYLAPGTGRTLLRSAQFLPVEPDRPGGWAGWPR